MYTLVALAVTAFTAGVIAHPGIPAVADVSSGHFLRNGRQAVEPLNRKMIRDYLLPRYPRAQYVPVDERDRIPYPRPQMPPSNWLNEEITRISGMQEPPVVPHKPQEPWMNTEIFHRILIGADTPYRTRSRVPSKYDHSVPSTKTLKAPAIIPRKHGKIYRYLETTTKDSAGTEAQEKKIFALTPTDPGYFESTENTTNNATTNYQEGPHEGGGHEDLEEMERRKTRQNPISRTKTLVADDLDKLKDGVGTDGDSKDKYNIRLLGNNFTTKEIYVVGVSAGVITAIVLATLGFIFGWYTLSKRAKAAADVDYPAYGVTGPTLDTSGDRKLAHSAQMYHYQHQKQQIIAMERTSVEQRNGSVTDPESEEENEEGDYTVYECPGFATTGVMEVQNPLFNEESTPATPGNVEVVKAQPTE